MLILLILTTCGKSLICIIWILSTQIHHFWLFDFLHFLYSDRVSINNQRKLDGFTEMCLRFISPDQR